MFAKSLGFNKFVGVFEKQFVIDRQRPLYLQLYINGAGRSIE